MTQQFFKLYTRNKLYNNDWRIRIEEGHSFYLLGYYNIKKCIIILRNVFVREDISNNCRLYVYPKTILITNNEK